MRLNAGRADGKNKVLTAVFCPVAALLLFASCSARISGSLAGDGQADLAIYASLEPRITALIGGLALASGSSQPQAPVLDGPAIAASMSAAPGVALVSFANRGPAAIEGPVKISRVGDFLAAGGAAGFISFEQGASPAGGPSHEGRCAISISLDSGPEMLALISPDVRLYLEALMAPLATGEALTKAE